MAFDPRRGHCVVGHSASLHPSDTKVQSSKERNLGTRLADTISGLDIFDDDVEIIVDLEIYCG